MSMSDTRSVRMNDLTFTTWNDYDREVQVVNCTVERDEEEKLRSAGKFLLREGWKVHIKEGQGEGIYKDDTFIILNAEKVLELSDAEKAELGKKPSLYVPKGSVEVTEKE